MFYRVVRRLLIMVFAVIFRMKTEGLHNIPKDGPVLLCSNHISLLDPPVVGVPLNRKVHFMAKAELFDIPVLGIIIRNLGAFPVKRGGVSKESIRHSINLLKEGNVMGIFPAGTRNNTEGMGKKGAAMFAIKSGAVVIPAAIVGNYKLFRPMMVRYGKPVDLSDCSDDLELATEKIMVSIRELAAK
ncbi:1-acyl-sn-glycerol-3-phosphate acyltransferase [Paenibacillus sp. N1-5-1-14]|uniref:lysophospholipid acyltransferase family protein n=1 Tax=Paenibacillus radicibacter TaxID=2972488 RepID=UPI002158A96A|nr:lysophospholipid acyltransferase family protein [Paenibacillus radicibacter]MCR8642316.1 1-acyl-sn-glycerol-3-phosphate acyltransferase [Paenibacillus radicibacter]